MRDALMRLLEPPIEALDYELVDIEYAREGRGGVVRVFIDRRVGELGGGPQASITVDDCARVRHAVSELLESEASTGFCASGRTSSGSSGRGSSPS